MPTTGDQVTHATGSDEPLSPADGQLVVEASHPTEFFIEVGGSAVSRYVIRVLRPRSIATDFRLIVYRFAVGKRAKKHQPVGKTLLALDLQSVITRIAAISNVR